MRALLLVRRGGPLTPALAEAIRNKGYDPFVLSSRTFDDGSQLRSMMTKVDIEFAISDDVVLDLDEAVDTASSLADCAFCLTVSDSQRVAMAAANRLLGAHDVAPAAVTLALDKHLMRAKLVSRKLSRLAPYRLSDPELRQRLDAGEKFIVKPRRGVSSLCIGVATSWGQVEKLRAAFAQGPGDQDILEEYFRGNELVAETFFEGEELSVDLIRQDGVNRVTVPHGKAGLEYRDGTVLELGHISPPTRLNRRQQEAATDLVDQALAALDLTDGCYHVEVRVDERNRCELIEVNPRVAGHLLWDSVRLQHDRSLIDDWMDVLVGNPVIEPGEPACGTYMEVAYPAEGAQVLGVRMNPMHPQPAVLANSVTPGMAEIAYREEPAVMSIWTTDRARHDADVAFLQSESYAQFVYPKPRGDRPLLLVLEPTDDTWAQLSDVDSELRDVLVFHSAPVQADDAYTAVMDSLSGLHRVDWSDVDAAVAAVLAAVGTSTVADTIIGNDAANPAAAAIRAKLALG